MEIWIKPLALAWLCPSLWGHFGSELEDRRPFPLNSNFQTNLKKKNPKFEGGTVAQYIKPPIMMLASHVGVPV